MNIASLKVKFFEKLETRVGRTYIVPTRLGFYCIGTVFGLLLISLSYGHSLAFSMTFLFSSALVVSMFYTNSNLSNLEVIGLWNDDYLYADKLNVINVELYNHSKKMRFDLELMLGGVDSHKILSVRPLQSEVYKFHITNIDRGPVHIKTLCFKSSFPFGLFEAWTYRDVSKTFVVIPANVNNEEMHDTSIGDLTDNKESERHSDGVDFYSHKGYALGMPTRHIDWRVYARGRGLFIKQFEESSSHARNLKLESFQGDLEVKLGKLCFAIQQLAQNSHSFSVEIGMHKVDLGHSQAHEKECLELAANFRKSLRHQW